ncbi:MAG: Fic family protein [Nanoarchaeota archaeon]|nr:Fic family protein [Nanoarchaeota archaeon]MBU1976583.1 Fic family protein [Nanoarchaeota archaeon]
MDSREFETAFGVIKEREDLKWGNHLVFIPNKLPPEIRFNKQLALSISRSDAKLGKLSGVGLLLPNPNLLIMPYLKKEALMSSRIEGTRISLSELLLSEAKGTDENIPDAFEVVNYVNAVRYGLDRVEKNPIDLELIKEMHKILMRGVRGKDKFPGEYRDVQNWIGPRNCIVQEATFVPPGPEDVNQLMSNLLSYLNSDDGMPLLIKCALMHYQFETIHPFCDGNGRIGRALITLYLCKKKLMIRPLLYLSGFFEANKREYASLLLKTNKEGNFDEWLDFFLEAITVQAEDALQRATKIQELREEYRKITQDKFQTSALAKLIDELFVNPYITITNAERLLKVTYPTAKRLIEILTQLEILKLASKQERNKVYIAHEILRIMEV